MSKKENERFGVFSMGVFLLIFYILFDSTYDVILYISLAAIFLGLLALLYPLLSRRKRFSNAQLEHIDVMTGNEFEAYTAFLLAKHQFEQIKQTKDYGDQGIDVIATKNGITYGIQCKRWKKNVGNKAIQEVYAGIGYYSLDQAIVLTNSYYTESAKQLSHKLKVELWDRKTLTKMIEESLEQVKN